MHNLLFFVHTLCMSYVIKTFLLVSSSVSSKQLLCFVHGQGQKREQRHTTKNFVEFHNHSPLLNMIEQPRKTQRKRGICTFDHSITVVNNHAGSILTRTTKTLFSHMNA